MSYDASIARLIKKFLDEDDWKYDFDANKGLFSFGLNLSNKLKKVSYCIRVRDDCYMVYAISPLNADDCKAEIAEFITRANYGLRNGNFEMDFDDGEIRYKSFVDFDGTVPGTQVIRDSIYVPASMFKRYGNGIVNILFGLKSPADAVAECEAE